MANLINAERVSITYGTRTLLAGVSLGLGRGEVIGVVGRNGDGKSTLLRILIGRSQPATGRVVRTGMLSIGYLDQDDAITPQYSGSDVSGGERRRTALAAILLGDHELLVLDEPTNHLDVDAVAWLAEQLRLLLSRGVALIVVSHDRWFLDAVCTRMWEVHDGTVDAYDGGYSAYVLARAERARQAAGLAARRRNLLRKELAWLRRGPPARTSKPKFRIDAANALIADEPEVRDRAELVRFATARLGKSVLDVEDATLEIGGRRLVEHVTWRLGPGDRDAIVGVNGSGKTTFLRLLRGELRPARGTARMGATVRLASLTQDLEELDGTQRVLESLESVRRRVALGDGRELTAGQLWERFGFGGNR